MTRGELYRVHKPGGDPKRYRIFVIVSRQILIDSKFSAVAGVPVFSTGQGLSTQVAIGTDEGLKHDSWIFCDNLTSLLKTDLTDYVGTLSPGKLLEVNSAVRIALALA